MTNKKELTPKEQQQIFQAVKERLGNKYKRIDFDSENGIIVLTTFSEKSFKLKVNLLRKLLNM